MTHTDTLIEGPKGRLFVRTWSPEASVRKAPIILLHDSLGCVQLWRGLPETLARATGRQVVAYDRLGFGESAAHPGKLGLDFINAEAEGDFDALRSQLGLERFILLGHSVGGCMAINCAARFGTYCVALLTLAAQVFVEDVTLQGIRAAKTLFEDPKQLERLRKYHGDKAQWVLDAWTGSWLHPAFSAWSHEAVLPQVKCPTLVIHGMEDEYGSAAHARLIAERVTGPVQLEIQPGTGHFPHRENEAAVVETLARFIQPLA